MKQIGLTLLCYLSIHFGTLHGQTREKQYIGRYTEQSGYQFDQDSIYPVLNAEAPFPTDKPDGFYWVKEVDLDNYANTHLEDDAVLSLKDIEIAKHEFTPDGRPVVTVNLTAEGKEKLATFTGNHIGQHMAIVVDKTVLSIPRIQEEIPGGSLQISGNFTVEEVQNIARRLNNR